MPKRRTLDTYSLQREMYTDWPSLEYRRYGYQYASPFPQDDGVAGRGDYWFPNGPASESYRTEAVHNRGREFRGPPPHRYAVKWTSEDFLLGLATGAFVIWLATNYNGGF